jgi:CubicO group peptidase (beta-lactamase class C family)
VAAAGIVLSAAFQKDMLMRPHRISVACLLLALGCGDSASSQHLLRRLDGTTEPVEQVGASIEEVMARAGVTGLSCAIINDSRVVYRRGFGVRDKDTGAPNDGETVFAAASFSKTVFAYLAMLLVEEGVLDLDTPLQEYLGRPLAENPSYADLAGDDRAGRITARTALSHTTGFPNWRFLTEDGRLAILFEPGSRFSYSGEGIALLQMVIEQLTGSDLEELSRELIFRPLRMEHTSYVWQEAFEVNHAVPHDQYERPKGVRKRREADAAGSMTTTAADYARFFAALLDPEAAGAVLVDSMLTPQIAIRSERMFGPGAWTDTDEVAAPGLSWALGWGMFDSEAGRAFFHTGHDFGWQNYAVAYRDRGIGVVLMSNSDNFESVAREITAVTIGDTYSPFDWLGYPRFDPNRRREPPPQPVAIDVAPSVLEAYVGEYRLMAGETVFIKLEERRLYVSTDAIDWTELLAESETRFFTTVDDTRFVFVSDDSGTVTGVTIEIGELDVSADKVK